MQNIWLSFTISIITYKLYLNPFQIHECHHFDLPLFFKTLFKGNTFAVRRVREGLIRFWSPFCIFYRLPEKIELFTWWHLLRLVERIIFKINVSKTDLPIRFCKIGLGNTLFIFGRKSGRLFMLCLFCLFCFVCFVLFCFVFFVCFLCFLCFLCFDKVVCCNFVRFWLTFFLKPFFKGTNFAVEWEGGKFDFDHYFAILTNFPKRQHFLGSGIWFGSSKGSFSKKNLSKTDLPFKFCKIGLKNTLFIFGRKMVVCCCLFVCCLVQLCPILAYFFLIVNWSTH